MLPKAVVVNYSFASIQFALAIHGEDEAKFKQLFSFGLVVNHVCFDMVSTSELRLHYRVVGEP